MCAQLGFMIKFTFKECIHREVHKNLHFIDEFNMLVVLPSKKLHLNALFTTLLPPEWR